MRRVSALARKDRERRRALEGGGQPLDPFLPHDEALHVADLPPAHLCVLNKFNVLPCHLLVVTRRFEPQDRLLRPADFEALWSCMAGADSFGFYNGGAEAGASQRHKHLQVVPLPLGGSGAGLPIEPLLEAAPRRAGPVAAPGLRFAHRLLRFEPELGREQGGAPAARRAHRAYLELAAELGVAGTSPAEDAPQGRPYNFLLTRRHALLVPRSAERFHGVSVNAIGFAGGLLVRSEAELDEVVRVGPMAVLEQLGVRP